MKQDDQSTETIDYRSPASRSSDRSHASKSNIVAIVAVFAVIIGLGVFLIGGF
jgi:hypothetical protein